MRKLLSSFSAKAIVGIIVLIIVLAVISWALFCGVAYAITLCFGWSYSLRTVTGVWLILLVVSTVFNGVNIHGSN